VPQRLQPVRGMRDFVPPTARVRQQVAGRILEVYESYGFEPIETPALEDLATLTHGGAGENEKLMFKVLRRGASLEEALAKGEELADAGLRFDLTVPLARFVANHLNELPTPFKAAHVAPVWRAERPQRGRYREFMQCDIDIVGEPSVAAEVELLSAGLEALEKLGIGGCTVRLSDRRLLRQATEAHLGPLEDPYPVYVALDRLGGVPAEDVVRELSGYGPEQARALVQWAATADLDGAAALPGVKPDVIAGLRTTLSALEATGYRARFDPSLVRGIGYYTGQVFEVSHPSVTYSLAGGGRYDSMAARFGGPALPMCGFSIGFERVLELVGPTSFSSAKPRVAILCTSDEELLACLARCRKLRNEDPGSTFSVLRRARNARKQREDLEKLGYTRVVGAESILGQ
jgi:histidyl-tRNA synthetase